MPPVLVVSETAPIAIPVRAPAALAGLDLDIVTESGQKHRVWLDLADLPAVKSAPVNGEILTERLAELRSKLPLGYHDARAGGCAMRLIVTPDRAGSRIRAKMRGPRRHAVRSALQRNWGCGDFRDLRDLIAWAAPRCTPTSSRSTRCTRSKIAGRTISVLTCLTAFFIATSFISTLSRCPVSRASAQLRGHENAGRDRSAPRRPGRRVRTGSRAEAPRARSHLRRQSAGRRLSGLDRREGDLLRLFATCSALDEHLHAAHPGLWVWPDWPEEYRDPASDAVSAFRARP